MEDCIRVVLYGTFDGADFSSDNFLQVAVNLDSGEKVKITTEYVTSADEIVKKDEIKLKDVIKRIEKFDLGTKAVWINGILNELGSGYGSFKYKQGYEQGKLEGAMEREEVQVPQFIAEFIAEQKKLGHTLSYSIDACMSDRVAEWYWDNPELFARAWLDGYKVDEEKRYRVKLKSNPEEVDYLVDTKRSGLRFYSNIYVQSREHTRKEIEAAGFGWVFDCPGVEVEEVEE